MKVKDLIAILKKADPELYIGINSYMTPFSYIASYKRKHRIVITKRFNIDVYGSLYRLDIEDKNGKKKWLVIQ